MNSKLTVRESQWAVFMNEGAIADVFTPGMYTLSTQNMPILTTLKGWKYGFNSPFKADVFFVSTRQFINQKWGTRNPIMLRDAEFGPVRIRAFGSFAFRVKDPGVFIKEIAATNPEFSVEGVNEQLRNLAVSRGMDAIAEAKIPVLDLAANYDEVSAKITERSDPNSTSWGLSSPSSSLKIYPCRLKWKRPWTNAAAWASWVTWAPTHSSRRPMLWSRRLRTPMAAVLPAQASVQDWEWPSAVR